MRFRTWFLSALTALGVASCGENAPPPSQSQTPVSGALADRGRQTNTASRPQQQDAAIHNDAPAPPKDAQWTILCDTLEGPAHVADASLMKARLIQVSGMHDWYVIHSEKDSTIYYGYYRSLADPAEKGRAENDRARIGKLTDQLGNRLLRGDVLVAITAPDPQAPAAWNLLNARRDAYWTIEIATFAGNPKRKEAAVDAVRELREKGETEAYYYHGASASSVCIGAWPRDAVAEQGTGINRKGDTRDDAHTQSPDQPLFVFAADAAPPNIPSRVFEPGTGKPMTVEGLKLDIQSPEMKKKIAAYPYHYVNYELHTVESNGQQFPDSSMLCIIPRDQSPAGDDDWRLTGGPVGNPQTAHGQPPVTPGDSQLRSIGDH